MTYIQIVYHLARKKVLLEILNQVTLTNPVSLNALAFVAIEFLSFIYAKKQICQHSEQFFLI